MHVADCAHADAPGAEDDVGVTALGVGGQRRQHRAHSIHGRHVERRVVVETGLVVDRARLADADHEPVELGNRRVQLVERLGVDAPELRVRGVERPELVGEVLLERGVEGQHVGAQEHVDAEIFGVREHRAESIPHRFGPREMLGTVGVDPRRVEGQVLDESRKRDRGETLRGDVPHVQLEGVGRGREGAGVDIRRLGQDRVDERSRNVRVVIAGQPLGLIGVDADRSEVGHAERESRDDLLAQVSGDRSPRAHRSREVVDAARGARLGRSDDAQGRRVALESVPVVVDELAGHRDGQRCGAEKRGRLQAGGREFIEGGRRCAPSRGRRNS